MPGGRASAKRRTDRSTLMPLSAASRTMAHASTNPAWRSTHVAPRRRSRHGQESGPWSAGEQPARPDPSPPLPSKQSRTRSAVGRRGQARQPECRGGGMHEPGEREHAHTRGPPRRGAARAAQHSAGQRAARAPVRLKPCVQWMKTPASCFQLHSRYSSHTAWLTALGCGDSPRPRQGTCQCSTRSAASHPQVAEEAPSTLVGGTSPPRPCARAPKQPGRTVASGPSTIASHPLLMGRPIPFAPSHPHTRESCSRGTSPHPLLLLSLPLHLPFLPPP